MPQPFGEFAYIDWLRQQIPPDKRVLLGPGDDCAVIQPGGGGPLIATTDMLMEGSCFLLAEAGPLRVGRKAMNVNLSDIAAMAGIPEFALISVGLPREMTGDAAKELFLGMRQAAEAFGVAIVGGDTNSWDGGLVISITLIGSATGRGVVTRSGAKQGDAIFVTGALGGSILGKHLDFTPRVREALRLNELAEIHAMLDISDGLAKDLHRIAEASGCGARLFAESIPISRAAVELAKVDGASPLLHVLGDGEDFELLFTLSNQDAELLQLQPVEGLQLFRIGEMIERGFEIVQDGTAHPLRATGYEHIFGNDR